MAAGEMERVLKGLVREGTVTAVDHDRRMARVKFQSEDMTSGWLYVLQHHGTKVEVAADGGHGHILSGAGRHDHPGSSSGAAGLRITEDGEHVHEVGGEPSHEHTGTVTAWWTPRINERVVCLYLPVFNGDGFILGTV